MAQTSNPVWRLLKARWFLPCTKMYYQAFADACACWILGINLFRPISLIMACGGNDKIKEQDWSWYGFNKSGQMVLGWAEGGVTGTALGWCFFLALAQWKLKTREGTDGRPRKRIMLACRMLQIPVWLYACVAIVVTVCLSGFATFITKWVIQDVDAAPGPGTDDGTKYLTYYITWFSALVVITAIDVVAVVAGAIIRLKYLAPHEKNLLAEKEMRGIATNTATDSSV